MESKIVESKWGDKPESAGAYWMRHNESGIYIICLAVQDESDKIYIMRAGFEDVISVDDLKEKELSFFGPISLPEGTAHIFSNGVYKNIGEIAEPK